MDALEFLVARALRRWEPEQRPHGRDARRDALATTFRFIEKFLRKIFPLLAVLVASAANAASTSITVPDSYENVEGDINSIGPFGIGAIQSMRFQQVYNASAFTTAIPNGGWITEIDCRVDGTFGYGFASTLPDIQ